MAIGSALDSMPKTKARPLVGRMRSRMVRIVVVLPAPFGPRKPKTSPSLTWRSTSMIPRAGPYDFVSFSVWMIADMLYLPAGLAGELPRWDGRFIGSAGEALSLG